MIHETDDTGAMLHIDVDPVIPTGFCVICVICVGVEEVAPPPEDHDY